MNQQRIRLAFLVSLGCALGLIRGVRLPLAAAGGAIVPAEEKRTQDTAAAPVVTLIEGERVPAHEVVVLVQSTLIEEADAVRGLSEANLNNVRYNINGYPIGYAVASETVDDHTVFQGPLKAWRATGAGEVSRWPPHVYPASRKETMRQAKLIVPVPLAEAVDEMNNLRVYYRPLLVGHDGQKYQEQPAALAFFAHPKTGTRMTAVFRDERCYASINEPLVAHSRVFVKEVVPGRGKDSATLVPRIFYSKDVSFDVDPFSKGNNLDRLMRAVIAAHENPPLATEDFKALFKEMSQHAGGKTDPIARSAALDSTQRKR